MEYSYKFRLYPNREQKILILRTFGCCRFVFNYYLDFRKKLYELAGETANYYDCANHLTKLKQELPWLREVDSNSLRYSLRDLDAAYQNFFRRVKQKQNPGFPHFKRKRERKQSYKTQAVNRNIKVLEKAVQLPKLGLVKCRVSKLVEGRILSATVSRSASGKYYVSLCCTDVEMEKLPSTGSAIGLDMGIKAFAVSSDGVEYANHKYLRKSEKKLKRLQRQLSRKTKGSANRDKARMKVARLHEHVANQRKDMLHKLSTELIRQNDVLCIEDLAPKNMVRNHKLAKSIVDVSWGEFRRQLTYKAKWYGKQLIAVDRFYPSSQICSVCGEKWGGTKDLKVRKWQCQHCGTMLDRDANAAINILNEGLRQLS